MSDFLLAPILALFSAGFYKRRLLAPRKRGFLYIGYLSFLFSLWILFLFLSRGLPLADSIVRWMGKETPDMVFTREGVRMAIDQPLLLTHPQLGPLFYLDPGSDFPKPEDLTKALVVIARKQVAFRDPSRSEYRLQDLTPRTAAKDWRDFMLNGKKILQYWDKFKLVLPVLYFAFAFAGIYLWKLLAGLFYSLVGLLWNLSRRDRLGYSSILNLSFFALGPVTLLQIAGSAFPVIPSILASFPVAFVVTSASLALAIVRTQTHS